MTASGGHAGGAGELVSLTADHPGFSDPAYRRRRNEIARLALEYRAGDPVPAVVYTDEEHAVWREVRRNLDPLHARYACREYLEGAASVSLPRDRIPQLAEVNATIEPVHGFRMLPVAGLVSARTFLAYLGRGAFLSTQYMRHHSVPLYTPEPDVVHELVGHAATFAHAGFARLNRTFGEAVLRAGDDHEAVEAVGRLYWFTLEFGVLRERDGLRVYGAGLLSSFGELGRFETKADLQPFDAARVARTPYDPTSYQAVLYVAPGFAELAREIEAFLARRIPRRD